MATRKQRSFSSSQCFSWYCWLQAGFCQDKQKEKPMNTPVSYRTVQVDDLSIFYREAGPKDAPALLLLHGLPSSSRMYEPLLQRLSDRYHFIALDVSLAWLVQETDFIGPQIRIVALDM